VPASSQVHKTSKTVYDRSNDGDFKVTEPHRIAEIFNRKRLHYTESVIYPELHFSDFKQKLFPKIRNLIKSNNPNHPWLALDNEQMLKKAGLWRKDFQSRNEGYTLAAALLLGKDEIIHSILPHYKTDALVRITNLSRYDDREYIDTNLIESYEKLMAFVEKHLPDKFFMERDQRVSLRNKIFRELVANMLVHREYTNAYPATFTIYKDRVETDNANIPHGSGLIHPNNFVPFPKNPTIAKFFVQLGWVEELGSGVLNVTKFLTRYSPGKRAQFIEGDSFKSIVPLDEKLVGEKKVEKKWVEVSEELLDIDDRLDQVIKEYRAKHGDIAGDRGRDIAGAIFGDIDIDTVRDMALDAHNDIGQRQEEMLLYCATGRTRKEILKKIKLVSNVKNYNTYVAPLVQMGWLEMTIPNKPSSPKQKYRTALKGQLIFHFMNYVDEQDY
jgi:predicted HTH transcriptional regulator